MKGAELLRNAKLSQSLPNESTVDQFFDSEKFGSYRLLGKHIGQTIASRLLSDVKLDAARSVAG